MRLLLIVLPCLLPTSFAYPTINEERIAELKKAWEEEMPAELKALYAQEVVASRAEDSASEEIVRSFLAEKITYGEMTRRFQEECPRLTKYFIPIFEMGKKKVEALQTVEANGFMQEIRKASSRLFEKAAELKKERRASLRMPEEIKKEISALVASFDALPESAKQDIFAAVPEAKNFMAKTKLSLKEIFADLYAS